MKTDPSEYISGVLAQNRVMLSRTITLIESALPAHQELAGQIIDQLLPHTGKALRLGITGVPGAGKSTFIDRFGSLLIDQGYRVAVLAIDPSSTRSGGSILGDKTRMQQLSVNHDSFIRPSPSGGTLGGVARKTRETMLVCEAAGFDVIIIETVGVGQSETAVSSLVDFFLVLMLAGAGDELQGIKKGILEIADAIIINKADGPNKIYAEQARREYETAVHLLTPASTNWTPPVMTCSALKAQRLTEIWQMIARHRQISMKSGEHHHRRQQQALDWLFFLLNDDLKSWFFDHPQVKEQLPVLIKQIENNKSSPTAAASQLLKILEERC